MKNKIIIADDEPALRELVADYFEDENYTVLQADDGEVAVELMKNNPDTAAVILDVMMPQLDGWAACRRIHHPLCRRVD